MLSRLDFARRDSTNGFDNLPNIEVAKFVREVCPSIAGSRGTQPTSNCTRYRVQRPTFFQRPRITTVTIIRRLPANEKRYAGFDLRAQSAHKRVIRLLRISGNADSCEDKKGPPDRPFSFSAETLRFDPTVARKALPEPFRPLLANAIPCNSSTDTNGIAGRDKRKIFRTSGYRYLADTTRFIDERYGELQECRAVLGDEDFLISGCRVASDLTYFTQFPRRVANQPIAVSNVSSKPYFQYYQISSSFSLSTCNRATFERRLKFPSSSSLRTARSIEKPGRWKFDRTYRLDNLVYAAPRERRKTFVSPDHSHPRQGSPADFSC